MYIGLHVKYLSDFNETGILSTDFRKYSNIKFHDNPSNESLVVPCGRKGRHDEVNRHVRKIGNVPKIHYLTRKLSSQTKYFVTHIRHDKMP
jgi:hypothetical protein